MPTRRQTLKALLGTAAYSAASSVFGQGVATRKVKRQPRLKSTAAPFAARFKDVAQAAGLHAPVIYGELSHKDYILEAIGCGCAFVDYDNDGWMDIFLLSGQRINDTPPGTTNRLYKNNRDGTFTDMTREAGLEHTGWACGICVGDYDNDGYEDLFITYWGQNKLYHNNGNGTFTDVTGPAGLLYPGKKRWGAGCTFTDYNRDGHLDLFVSNYIDFEMENVPRPGANVNCNFRSIPVNCGPRGLPYGRHWLYRNNGDGTFTDVSDAAGISRVKETYGMTAVAADFDDDGWPDIYVACDSVPSVLFMNNHDGTFREEALARGVALSDDGVEQAGMGVGVGDYNLDGRLDIFKTHFSDDTSVLYRNLGKGNFDDATEIAHLAVETRFTGWGAGIVDLDNDGNPDLLLVTGTVYPEVATKLPAYPAKTPRVVFRNLGNGRFDELIEEAGLGIAAAHSSRGAAFGDFDNDGDIDVLIVNLNEPPSLLRNDLPPGAGAHWIKVKLTGRASNRSAIGARITAKYGGKRQVQEVLSQSSFFSSNDPRLHFGLGHATLVDLRVRWPSGTEQVFAAVPADQIVTIDERDGLGAQKRPVSKS
jgi:hypothetical protein